MLKGKNALITGSTSGIGLGIAEGLAKEGCHIILNGFGEPSVIQDIIGKFQQAYGVQVMHAEADLMHSDAIDAMLTHIIEKVDGVDILVNNAGIQHVESVEFFPEEKWDAVLATNLSAAFHTTRRVIPGMRKKAWGRIINIASAHGLVASAKKSAYVAAKHGMVGFTKSVALELAGSGVTCNAICPGWVLTPLVEKQIIALQERTHCSYEEAKLQLLSEKQPSKEFVTVEEIGALTAFLAGDLARSITGTTVSIDGGWTAQ